MIYVYKNKGVKTLVLILSSTKTSLLKVTFPSFQTMKYSQSWMIVTAAWLSAMLLGQLTITALLFIKTNAEKTLNAFVKYSTLWCVCCYCINTGCDLTHTSMAIKHTEQLSSDNDQMRTIQTIADIPYFVATISLYAVIIGRLWICFRDSDFVLSRKYIAFISLLITGSIICMALYSFTKTIDDSAFIFLKDSVKYVSLILINEIVIDIGVLALFIYKLQQVLVGLVDINVDEVYEEPIHDNNRSTWSRRTTISIVTVSSNKAYIINDQTRLLSLITKQTILGCIQMLFNCSFYIKIMIDAHFVSKSWSSDLIFQRTYCLRSISNLIVIFALYLNFSFNTDLYHKICGCWHKGCYKCCVKTTERKMAEKEMEYYRQL